jgi:hypothetical protein
LKRGIDEEHKPVGIISWRDILRAISREAEEGGGKEDE